MKDNTIDVTDKDAWAHALLILRARKGYSVETLAKKSRCSPSTIRSLEDGLRVPRLRTLFKVLTALGYTMTILPEGKGK